MAYENKFICVVQIAGQDDLNRTTAGVMKSFTLGQDAVDDVKNVYGNNLYELYQKVTVTKADTVTP